MENNNLYNLINQLTQESKSLWRIKKNYLSEASTEALKNFWEKLAADKEAHVRELKDLIKAEME